MSSTELCRLCAGRSDEIPIFGSKEYLPYKINFTLNIEVKETDNRKTICLLCKSKLTEFHDFKNMCRNTEAQGLGSQKSSEIPPILAVKIKEEPKDFQEVVKQLASVPVPNAEPIKLVPVSSLPFLFKNDVKKEEPDSDSVKSPRTSPASNSSVESSVDYLINQVDTDDSKSSLEDGKRDVDKGADSPEAGGLEIAAPADSTSCEDAATADHISSENCALENSSSLNTSSIEDDAPGGEEAPANGGGRGRGRKRRGRQPEPELKKRRLTRSSSGVLPKKKIIIDESEDDSDPDDPEYREQGQQPVSDSESDEETQSPSGKATKTATKSPTKYPAKSPSPEVKPNSSKTLPEGTCVKCEKQFPSLMALESHQMEDHFNETWYCYDCLCGFPNFKTWKYHKRNFCKRSAVIRICTLCQGSFKSYEELKVHAETCKGTSEKGANASLPVKIIDPPNGKPTFRCSFCAIETDDNTEFLEHLKVHKKNSVSSLKCNQCDKTFKEKGALICHKEFHHKNTKLSNSASDKTSTVKPSVISDKIDHNSKTVPTRKYSKEYKCNKCDEVFSNSGKLICHQVLSHKKK